MHISLSNGMETICFSSLIPVPTTRRVFTASKRDMGSEAWGGKLSPPPGEKPGFLCEEEDCSAQKASTPFINPCNYKNAVDVASLVPFPLLV